MKDRLLNKFGHNSEKDAEETRRKIEGLHGDHRGWDIYLAALDSLVEVLTKTPVRDTANNLVMQPVPDRPHQLSIPPTMATLADFLAYKNDDANVQRAWELLNPSNKSMNHRPTDVVIKNSVMLALGSSVFGPRSAAEMQNPSPYNSGYESSFSRLPALDTHHLRAETPTLTTKWNDTFVINAWPPSSTPHPRPHSIIFPAPAPKLAISTPSTCAIAAYHHGMANDPNSEDPPPSSLTATRTKTTPTTSTSTSTSFHPLPPLPNTLTLQS